MRYVYMTFFAIMSLCVCLATGVNNFPDGTPIPPWFSQTQDPAVAQLGDHYCITDFGVEADSTLLQTDKIQAVIDLAAQRGGGVVVIPEGTFVSASLFFKPRTHLYLQKGAVIKCSDDIANFPVVKTRIEGQTVNYFPALINADGLDGFTISGQGTLNGNGMRYWRSFWKRRAAIPKCTNMDELRPRLLYVSNSRNVRISDIRLINSPFWTTHFYKCDSVKLIGLYIFSPASPVKAPSTDGIDIDVCKNFLVKDCYLSVNDDAIALKGGKGPMADKDSENGANENIIIEDCIFGFCHGVLTCGSESIYNRNIVVRRCIVDNANRLLWLKMRADTPQNYEFITVEDIKGSAGSLLFIKPWTQFLDLKGQNKALLSYSSSVVMRNIDLVCETFFNVEKSEQYILSDFTFQNVNVKANNKKIDKGFIEGLKLDNLVVNGVSVK